MKKFSWIFLSVLVIILDQATKYWAEAVLLPYQPVHVLPILNFTLAYNTGAAFSFLGSAGPWSSWFFIGFNSLVSIGLLVWLFRMHAQMARLQVVGISLILGGAIGNLCDRLAAGHVTDFIEVFYRQYHWPIFNLADSAICIGAFLLVIDMFVAEKTKHVTL